MFHFIHYLLSQYFWVCVFACFLSFPFFLEYSQYVDIKQSKNTTNPFDSSIIPDYFVHLTDIHINHKYSTQINTFNDTLKLIDGISPMLAFFTGDLADNLESNKHPYYGTQQKEDHDIYYNMTQKYDKNNKLFETAGNHDEYGVYAFDSKGNYYNHNHNETVESFILKTVNFTLRNHHTIHFIIMNPYNYPSAHPPFLFWPASSQSFLDRVEDAVKTIPPNDDIIFLNHYPLNMFLCLKSSKNGRKFKEIAIQSAKYAISGHNHPEFPVINHQGQNLLEIVGSDLTTHKRMGLFTFDNDRFVYHYVNHSNPNLLFITNPVPTEQLTESQIFNEVNTPIRCIVFTQNHQPPSLVISGDINSSMTCQNVTKSKGNFAIEAQTDYVMFLCSAENSLGPGSYSIDITGTYNKSLDFIIGNTVPKFRETIYLHSRIAQFPVSFVVILILALIVFTPIGTHNNRKVETIDNEDEIEQAPNCSFQRYNDTIEGTIDDLRSIDIFISIFLGVLAVRDRISRLSNWLRYLLFFFVLYVLVFPISFMEIEGRLSVVWWYGYLSGGKAIYALWGQMYATFYLVLTILPAMFLSSTIALKNFHYVIFIDILVIIILTLGTAYMIFRYLSESVNMIYSLLSPGFIIIPLALYIILGIYAIKKWKKKSGSIEYDTLNNTNKSLLS